LGATIADVARRAGVGRGTVSRVLNNRPNVDPGTRARVLAAIAELDYVPSETARRLSLGRTRTIGVVVPFMTRPSAVERLRGIESALVHAGYDMIVFNVETAERRDAIIGTVARSERVDGLILVSLTPHGPEIARLRSSGLPTVLLDGHHRSLPRVVVDDVAGGRLATEYLLSLGHVRLGFVGDAGQTAFRFTSSRLRLSGMRQAMAAAKLALPASLVAVGAHSRQSARHLASRLLSLPLPPTALFAASDTQAVGVLEAARELEIKVPGGLSVIGYDDIELADYIGLTTIRQPLFETGYRAAQRVIARIDGRPAPTLRETLDVALVVRETTAPPDA
jgi:DNA-binding LacI/PurR family transcriptional regulator